MATQIAEMSDDTFNSVIAIVAAFGFVILVLRFWLERHL